MHPSPGADRAAAIGERLAVRRVELDVRYRNLRLFTDEKHIDYRVAWDIEHGARGNFRSSTLTALDVAYGLEPGTLRALLAGFSEDQAAVLRKAPEAFAALAGGGDTEAHEVNGA